MDAGSWALHTFVSLVHLRIRVNSPILILVNDVITPSLLLLSKALVYIFWGLGQQGVLEVQT